MDFQTACSRGEQAWRNVRQELPCLDFDSPPPIVWLLPMTTDIECSATRPQVSKTQSFVYGPRNLGPLKWIMCVGALAIQTSVSQAMVSRYFMKIFRFGNADT